MRTLKPQSWNFLFGLWGFQAIITLLWLLTIPTDTENPLAFGYSPARLVLIGTAVALLGISTIFWIKSRDAGFNQNWLNVEKHVWFWNVIYILALFTAVLVIVFLTSVPLFKNNPLYPVYAVRLRPLVIWFGLSALELSLFMAVNRWEVIKEISDTLRPIWKKTALILMFFLLLAGLVAITKIGITPDGNWGDPPVPFLEWQILLTLLITGILALSPFFSNKYEKWIPLGIYVFTVLLWLSQPIHPAFTATPPRAPNYEIYPFSDPQFYAQYAQSALTGNGFLWPEIPARPFYVAFLTWLHLLGNQSYQNIMLLQTLVLAIFPVLLYLIGRDLGGKPLGIGLALLAAFRDINANVAASFASNVTYSKLFLSEIPTALLISLATLLSLRWLRSRTPPSWLALLIGGVIGAAALIRLQSSILIVIIVFIAFFVFSNFKQWLKGTIYIAVGFALTITPWLIRNYIAAGGLVFDNPISQTMTMARRWSGSSGNELLPRLPGENDAQYSSRLTQIAIESFKRNPAFILHAAGNHFINSEIASLLAFPNRDEILSASEVLIPQHTFWKTPLTVRQIPLLAFYILLFSIGVAAAAHHHGLIGLLPLGLGLTYNLWTALFLSSGERFIVPLDWSVHLYVLLGLLILGGMFLSVLQGTHEKIAVWLRTPFINHPLINTAPELSRRYLLLSFLFILFLGAFLPATEFIFPQKYPPKTQAEIMQQLGVTTQQGEVALYGRAIYPRYYGAGDGEPGTAKLGYGPEPKARLVFFLVGPQSGLVIFELKDPPSFFPNASDVYMIGTQTEDYFSPRVVKVTKDSQTEIYTAK